MFRIIFTTLRALLKSGLCGLQLCIRSDTASYLTRWKTRSKIYFIFAINSSDEKDIIQMGFLHWTEYLVFVRMKHNFANYLAICLWNCIESLLTFDKKRGWSAERTIMLENLTFMDTSPKLHFIFVISFANFEIQLTKFLLGSKISFDRNWPTKSNEDHWELCGFILFIFVFSYFLFCISFARVAE